MTFELASYRFQFSARDRIAFPAESAGNVLRGWFGHALRKAAPVEYERIFEPGAAGRGPSGLANWPRPFVFRARHLNGRTTEPGERFWFGVNVFDLRTPTIVHFEAAFAHLASVGMGPLRGRADLMGVETAEAVSVPLGPGPEGVHRIQVEFRSPTELKGGDAELTEQPDFAVLFGRARDRISTLRALYGAGPLDIDFRSIGERASAVRLTRSELTHVTAYRRSSRSGQVHPLGGFVGVAEYEGALSEFLPYLEAAHWTGVGRQCVWGKGEIATEVADDYSSER